MCMSVTLLAPALQTGNASEFRVVSNTMHGACRDMLMLCVSTCVCYFPLCVHAGFSL